MNNIPQGKYGEELACRFLSQNGYKVLERNFRIRGGEIDIIALDGKTLVYVEVKTRTQKFFGLPEESVTFHKIKFLQRAAKFYRNNRKNLPQLERIDVVSVNLEDETPLIKLIRNAGF